MIFLKLMLFRKHHAALTNEIDRNSDVPEDPYPLCQQMSSLSVGTAS